MTSKLDNMDPTGASSSRSCCGDAPKGAVPLAAHAKAENFKFEIPPEAPVFYPTEREFQDPYSYINKIRCVAENYGICKIKPPQNWKPPFALDVDKVTFTPTIQKINELEANTRVKLNFLEQISKFWTLQGFSMQIPVVEERVLDLYTLHHLVLKEGGLEIISEERQWPKIAALMGYPSRKGIGAVLRTHFERLLYPYSIFIERHTVDTKSELESAENSSDGQESDDSAVIVSAIPKCLTNNEENLIDSPESQENKCQSCDWGNIKEAMLTCHGCDDSYHTFCLFPHLFEKPNGHWHCPQCVAERFFKPIKPFSLRQSCRKFNLQQFGEMADRFKTEYFNMPAHLVPTHVVEKEFWRIVSAIDEDVTIEYGADLHTKDYGSGFPTSSSVHLNSSDIEYVNSGWNLNQLPRLEGSMLGNFKGDISGMTVPRMYVGMCFAAFCWHNENHWSYSVNYLHWGEPKTWYGVPGSKAVAFEEAMKAAVPELFQSQPDLLQHLVTLMNPNILMNSGIPVYRTDQCAGEFIVTFPRTYHAGFNHGFNFAEGVNFTPADWLEKGRECIRYYSQLKRSCVFSHDELVCKMAQKPKKLSPLIAKAVYTDMLQMVKAEKKLRKNLLLWGITATKLEAFQLIPKDERQCNICKTTLFLSAITCDCTKNSLVCLRHYADFCKCPSNKHTLHYRYTIHELTDMALKLRVKVKEFNLWEGKVKGLLDRNPSSTLTLNQLKGLVTEAEVKKYPKQGLFIILSAAIEDAEYCASDIRRFESVVADTLARNSNNPKYTSLKKLELCIGEINTVPCVLEEETFLKDLLSKCKTFEESSKRLLSMTSNNCSVEEIKQCLKQGEDTCVELPSLWSMHKKLSQVKWMAQVTEIRKSKEIVKLETIRHLFHRGKNVIPDQFIKKELRHLQQLFLENKNWEQKAQNLLKNPSPSFIQEIDSLLIEAKDIKTYLPTKEFITETSSSIRQWLKSVNEMNASGFPPYIDVIENLIQKGKSIPLPLPGVKKLEQRVAAAYEWKKTAIRLFLKKNSSISLMEALSPRTPVSLLGSDKNRPKSAKGELRALRILQTQNKAKCFYQGKDFKYCICQQAALGVMMKCNLCKDWFHRSCVALPEIANGRIGGNFATLALQMGFKQSKFLCPSCLRTKRPHLENIKKMLISLEKLSVRLPEGEPLRCLTKRATAWQDKVKQLLQTKEFEAAISKLFSVSQRNLKTAAHQNKKKITALKKGTRNPDLQQYVQKGNVSAKGACSDNHSLRVKETQSYKVAALQEGANFANANIECVIHLSNGARQKLDDLMMEGDLLEVSLDETVVLWILKQASQIFKEETVLIDINVTKPSTRRGHTYHSDGATTSKKTTQCKQTKRNVSNSEEGTVRKRGRVQHLCSSSEEEYP